MDDYGEVMARGFGIALWGCGVSLLVNAALVTVLIIWWVRSR